MSSEGEIVWADGSSFVGQWKEGKFDGRGRLENPDGMVHEGQWQTGQAHGEGERTLHNGDWMEGEWQEGKLHGYGHEEIRSDDGSQWVENYTGQFMDSLRYGAGREESRFGTYEGQWHAGRRHGVGRHEASNGWTYRGKWNHGLRQGKGVLSSTMGHVFEGSWVQDHLPHGELTGRWLGKYVGGFKGSPHTPEWPLVRDGKGRWEGRNGDTYEGQWKDDYYDGLGTLRTKFASYEGAFWKSMRHGYGVLVASNGDWYEGYFAHDKFDGQGQRSDKSGVYMGQWLDGLRHGTGSFTTHSGVKHVGRWYKGARHGDGEMVYPDGSKFKGEFEADEKAGDGAFQDGYAPPGTEIAYSGGYRDGVRHGDQATFDGIYGDTYQGGFADGAMRGVGKFTFSDGEEYLGCWLAPGGPGQMPRRMSQMKRQTAGSSVSDSSSQVGSDGHASLDEIRAREMAKKAGDHERIPLELMPDALRALRVALNQGGLSPDERDGSRLKKKMVEAGRAAKSTARVGMALHQWSAGAHNPFASAGSDVLHQGYRAGTGLVEHGPPSLIAQARPQDVQDNALRNMDLSNVQADDGRVWVPFQRKGNQSPTPVGTSGTSAATTPRPSTAGPAGPGGAGGGGLTPRPPDEARPGSRGGGLTDSPRRKPPFSKRVPRPADTATPSFAWLAELDAMDRPNDRGGKPLTPF